MWYTWKCWIHFLRHIILNPKSFWSSWRLHFKNPSMVIKQKIAYLVQWCFLFKNHSITVTNYRWLLVLFEPNSSLKLSLYHEWCSSNQLQKLVRGHSMFYPGLLQPWVCCHKYNWIWTDEKCLTPKTHSNSPIHSTISNSMNCTKWKLLSPKKYLLQDPWRNSHEALRLNLRNHCCWMYNYPLEKIG